MIKEIKELFITALSRAFNPIISSFILSWLVFNYQIVLSVFSPLEYLKKIEIIQSQLCHVETAILYPFIYSLIYSLIIPWIDVGYTWFISKVNNSKERVLVNSQDTRTYDVDQAKELFENFRDEIKQHKDNYKLIYQNSVTESLTLRAEIKNKIENYQAILLCYFFRNEEDPISLTFQSAEPEFLNSHKIEIKNAFMNLFPNHSYLLSFCIESIMKIYNSDGDKLLKLNELRKMRTS